MLNISKENKIFGLVQIFSNAAYAIFFGYIILYLKNIGYSEAAIGVMMSITLALNILAQPIFGYLSDNYISIKKLVILCTLVMFASVVVVPFIKDSYWAIFLILAVTSFFGRPMSNMMDMYITRLSAIRSGLDFGFVRGLGSIGYAVTAMLAGKIIDKLGFNAMFIMHTFAITLLMIYILKAEDVAINKKEKSEKAISFSSVVVQLIKNRAYVVTILAAMLVFIAAGAHGTYISVIMVDMGGSSSDYGFAVFLSAASEAPIMWNYYRITKYFSNETILGISLGFYALRMLIILLNENLTVIIFMQLMQSVSFGLFITSFMRYLQIIIPENIKSTAILLGSALYGGISGVIGALLGGIILENSGYKSFYMFCFSCCIVGAGIFSANLIFTNKSGKADVTSKL